MYQVGFFANGEWHYKAPTTLALAKWDIDHVIVNPLACVIDMSTGEIVYGL